MTNNSLFTKVLVLVLCLMMAVGVLTSCFSMPELNNGIGTTTVGGATTTTTTGQTTTKPESSTTTTTTTTTGDSANKDPVPDPIDPNQIYAGSTTLENDDLIYGSLANSILIGNTNEVAAIIPADVKVEMGASSLELSVKKVEDESFSDSLSSLDIHVSGVALDNTVPMTVMLGAVLPSGLANTELKLYHIEDGTPVLMTRVNSYNDFAIHNQYVYDAETGNVTIYVASFSVFSMVKSTPSIWTDKTVADISWYDEDATEFTLDNVAEFLGFRDLVDQGTTFEGKTVTLTTDIDLKNKLFDPIGFGYYTDSKRTEADGVVSDTNTVFLGTFDGGNHTIYNLYENCWELDSDKTNYSTYTYSTAGAGLFASVKNATIKNIAINQAEIVFECVDMGVLVGYAQGECHFENIVISNANIANYNRYTAGLVGEVSYGVDNNGDGYSHTFKNITIDSTVTVSGLWGSFGCGMGGVIGGKWGTAIVLMENVVSAPVMDVYNDVVSAYQWYAFRGCGMLIGHTEEPYSDGRTSGIATANFLTCKNVKVYYGDWVNYHYYEFENQDNTTGQRYPWVRAEEGKYCDAFSNIRYGVPTHDGVKVSDLTVKELKDIATDYTPIVFNQLYGADRGMYGQAEHDGVEVMYQNTKIIYFNNNLGWENLKLHYWYKHGDQTWTNIDDNGITLTEDNGIYKVVLPAYAFAFNITADGGNESDDFILADLEENQTYDIVTERTPVAEVGGVQYTSLQEAIDNAANGGTVTLIDDIVLTEAITINNTNVTIDLAGKTIDAAFEGEKVEAILISGNSNVTIKGNGTVIASGKGDYMQALSAIDGAIVTIENGTFISHGCSTIYATTGAQITINGGHYEATEAYFADGRYYTLDIDETRTDENFGSIIVCGGEYVNFNPANHTTDGAQFANMLDKNHHSIKNGNVYTVAEHEYIPSVTEPTCTTEGYTTHTCSCGDSYVDNQVDALGHIYVYGICSCNDSIRNTVTIVFAEHNISNATKVDGLTLNNIDFDASKGTHTNSVPAYYDSDGTIRVYQGNTLTINAPEDTVIFEITFTALDGYAIDNAVFTSGEITTSDNITTLTKINAYSVTITNESAAFRILEMSITYYECAHNGGTTVQTVDPTCTESGYINTVCNSCNQIINTIIGAPETGHTPGEDATCTTPQICTTCSEELKPATGHTPGDEATCTTPQTCKTCGEVIKAALGHNEVTNEAVAPTCTTTGLTEGSHCSVCNTVLVAQEIVDALGHTTENGVCDNCGETIGGSTEPIWILVTDVSELQINDKIIIVAKGYNYALSTNQKDNNRASASVEKNENSITFGDDVQIITLESGNKEGTFAFNVETGYLYAASSSANHLKTEKDLTDNSSWAITIESDGVATIKAQGEKTRNWLRYNATENSGNLFSCYGSGQKDVAIYKLSNNTSGGSGSEDSGETTCQHTNTTTNTKDATCVEAGSVTVTCDDCGETISAETIAATGNHTYEDGKCTVCGEADPDYKPSFTEISATLDFSTKNNRTVFTTSQQVWAANGITLTNDKGDSTSNVADYSNPARFYKSSKLTIEATGMLKIEFTCNSSSYATALKNSIASNSNYSVSSSGSIVTVKFVNAVDSFVIESLTGGQVRVNSITVTYLSEN